MRSLSLILLSLASIGFAQTTQYKPTEAQLLAGAKKMFEQYAVAISKNNGPQIAAFYHDTAVIVVTRQYSDGRTAAMKMAGLQYKNLMKTVPLTEAPDKYSNVSYKVVKGSVVEITTQRQSVSRGYAAPNIFYVQPDTTGRFWIIGEQGIQKVK